MIKEYQLSNGVRVIAEQMEHYRSVSTGVWIKAGSVLETGRQSGISHFIEHMVFKGTGRRSAQDIAVEMDALGGQLNAFTAKECTCYYAKTMDNHLFNACDMLGDIVLCAALDETEMQKERGVVLEEILMVEDSPEELVHEVLSGAFYETHPLGAPILGTKETVSAFTRDDLREYMAEHYTPGGMLVAVAGSFDEKRMLDCLEQSFKAASGRDKEPAEAQRPAMRGKRVAVREKDVEQLHIALALPGYAIEDERHYALLVLNNILGGSMSSRLFQKIREEQGKAYSVYSYTSSYKDSGALGLYAGTTAAQGEEVLEMMLEEMRGMTRDGVTKDEFLRSREQLKGSYVLGSESTGSRMNAIGKSKLLLGRALTEEDVFKRIEAVTYDDIQQLARGVFDMRNMSGAFVGPSVKSQEDWAAMW